MNSFKQFVENFSDVPLEYIDLKKNLFLESDSLREIRERIPFEPLASGLFLGKEEHQFRPSAALLEILSKHSDNKIVINDKAEWLFLCGRDVFNDNIVKDTSSSDLFLVQNERDQNLGLGKFVKKGRNEFVKNVFDRGDFLRRER